MGPYCTFCNQRCFVPLPPRTPANILSAYRSATIIATCQQGQNFEREKIGYCYAQIIALPNNQSDPTEAIVDHGDPTLLSYEAGGQQLAELPKVTAQQ